MELNFLGKHGVFKDLKFMDRVYEDPHEQT